MPATKMYYDQSIKGARVPILGRGWSAALFMNYGAGGVTNFEEWTLFPDCR